MGLTIHSLQNVPTNVKRDYYIYLLDYGWEEPLSKTMNSNFDVMAKLAEDTNAVVIRGPGQHFADEVFSWHSINGQDVKQYELLPALMITDRHPHEFLRSQSDYFHSIEEFRFVMIPFKKFCQNEQDVVNLILSVFEKVRKKEPLKGFEYGEETKNRVGRAFIRSIKLEPNIRGVGIDLKKFFSEIGPKKR